jgi:hypothetical protein
VAQYASEDYAQICSEGIILPGFIDAQARVGENVRGPYKPSQSSLVRLDRYEDPAFVDAHNKVEMIQEHAPCATQMWGELHALIGGTTSVRPTGLSLCADGLVRNIDRGFGGGMNIPPTVDWGQPDKWYPWSDEELLTSALEEGTVRRLLAALEDDVEFQIQGLNNQGLIEDWTTVIHGADLSEEDLDLLHERGSSLVWTPESDLRILGRTPPISYAREKGLHLALGSDGTLLGSGNMLRTMKCAQHLSQEAFGGFLGAKDIVEMATLGGAVSTGSSGQLGLLRAGHKADIIILSGDVETPYESVIKAENKNIELVIVGGEVRLGRSKWANALSQNTCLSMDVCGTKRMLCGLTDGEDALSIPDLRFSIQGALAQTLFRDPEAHDNTEVQDLLNELPYSLFRCEPASDIAEMCNLLDPVDVSNPSPDIQQMGWIRDADHDGLLYYEDNCLEHANPDQSDSDQDGLGDLCDACPNEANPEGQNCTYAIHDLRNPNAEGHPPYGTPVRLENLVVTGIRDTPQQHDRLITVQDPEAPEFGAISVFLGSRPIPVSQGDRVHVEGVYVEFYGGSYILSDPEVSKEGEFEGEMEIPNVPVEHISDGSAFLESYEAGLVRIEDVKVVHTESATVPEGQQLGFHVWKKGTPDKAFEGAAFVGDFFWFWANGNDIPEVGTEFDAIQGVLLYRFGQWRLYPRSLDDFVFAP